jgi:hypothetical protein
MSEYIRVIGKPVVEKATNGLRKITRRYVVHGPSSGASLVESRVFLPFCTPDEEYTNAVLVQQRLEGSEEVSQDVLVRVYLEVNDNPAEIEPPVYERDGVGRVKVTKSYIVQTPYDHAWRETRVGVEKWATPNGDDTILAKVVYDEKECYAEYKELYFEMGIISFKEEVRYNGKLIIRNYRSIGLTKEEFLAEVGLTPEWVLVSQTEGSGSGDYEYGGLEVMSWTVVKGEGRIVVEEEDKGSAQLTTEVIVVPDGGDYREHSQIPETQVFETKVEDKDGYDLWTIRGVIGEGEIDRKYEYRYNGALEIITIKNIGTQSGVPEGGFVRVSETHDQSGNFEIFTDVYVKGEGKISESVQDKGSAQITEEVWITINDQEPPHGIPESQVFEKTVEEKDGYEVHKIRGVVGSGEIERRVEVRHNGALEIITIKNIGMQSDVPAGYVRVSETFDQQGQFDIYTDVYAKGAGTIVKDTEDKGTAQVTTEVILTATGEKAFSSIPSDQIFKTKVEEKDGYAVHTISGVVGSGEIDRKHEYRNNGALQIITIKNIGQPSTEPAGFVRVSESHDQGGQFDIFTDVYVKGYGKISESVQDKGSAKITEEVWVTAENGSPAHNIPSAQVFETTLEKKDGYEIHRIKGVVGEGEIDRKTELRYNGALTILTIKNIGQPSTTPSDYVKISESHDQQGQFDVFTEVYAKGSGLISIDEEDKGTAQITTEVYITPNGEIPTSNIPADQVFKTKREERDGFTVHTLSGVVGDGEIERREESRHNGALSIITIKNIGQQSQVPPEYVRVSETHDQEGRFDVFTDVYARGEGLISSSKEVKGQAVVTTEKILTSPLGSPDIHSEISQSSRSRETREEKEGYVLHTITGVVGEGELERREQIKNNGALSIITIRNIGEQSIAPNGYARISSEEDDSGEFTIFTDIYAKGEGLIERVFEEKGTAEITTETILTSKNGDPQGFTSIPANQQQKVSKQEKDGYVVHTIFGIVGEGKIEDREETKHNGALVIRTIRNIGSQSQVPSGYVRISETHDQEGQFEIFTDVYAKGAGLISKTTEDKGSAQITTEVVLTAVDGTPNSTIPDDEVFERRVEEKDGYQIHTISGVVGDGEMEKRIESRYNDALSLVTIKNIGAQSQVPTGYVRVSESIDQSGRFDIYTDVYAKGVGLISKTTEEKGSASITTEVILSSNANDSGTSIPVDQIYKETVDNKDGYYLHTIVGVQGQGEIERKEETRNNGKLKIVTVNSIGQAALAPAGYTQTVSQNDKRGNFEVFTDIFVKGEGRVDTTVRNAGNDIIEETVSFFSTDDGQQPTGKLTRSEVSEDNGYVLYKNSYSRAAGNGESFVKDTRLGKYNITYVTVTRAGQDPQYQGSDGVVSKKETRIYAVEGNDFFRASEWVFAVLPADKTIRKSVKNDGILTTTKEVVLDKIPANAGCVLEESEEKILDVEGQTITTAYDRTTVEGQGTVDISVSSSKGITKTQVKSFDQVPNNAGGIVSKKEDKLFDVNGALCGTIYDYVFVEGQGTLEESTTTDNGFTKRKVRAIDVNPLPEPNEIVIAKSEEEVKDTDGLQIFIIYEKTFLSPASADNEILRSVSQNEGLTKTRIKKIDQAPALAGACLVSKSEEQIKDVDGAVGFRVYDYTFVEGQGEIDRSVSTSNGLLTTNIKSIGVVPNANGCIVRKKEEELSDVDGGFCTTVYEYTFLSGGDGEIERSVQNSGNVTRTRIKSFGNQPQNNGCLVVNASEDIFDIDGNVCKTLYNYEFIEDNGSVETSVSSQGGLKRTVVKTLGAAPALAGCLVSKKENPILDVDGAECLKEKVYEFLEGSGDIEKSVTTNTDGFTITRVKTFGAAPNQNGCVVSQRDEDVFDHSGVKCSTIYDRSFLSAPNVLLSLSTVSGTDGLTRTTIVSTQQGIQQPLNSCVLSHSEEEIRDIDGVVCITKYTTTYAQPTTDGEVERSVRQNNGSTITRIKSVGIPPNIVGACITSKQEQEFKDIDGNVCNTTYIYEFAENVKGTIDETSRTRSDGALEKTIRSVGAAPVVQGGCLLSKKEEPIMDVDGALCDTVYTYTFILPPNAGNVLSEKVTTTSEGLIITKISMANAVPLPPNGNACETSRQEEVVYDINGGECYTVYTLEYTEGKSGTVSQRTRSDSDGLVYRTIKTIGNAPVLQGGCLIAEKESDIYSKSGDKCITVYEYEFLEDASSYRVLSEKIDQRPGIKKVTAVTIAQPYQGNGCLVSKSERDITGVNGVCATVYTSQLVEGTGEYDKSISTRNGYSELTVKSIGVQPVAPNNSRCTLVSSVTDLLAFDGSVCDSQYETTFLIAETGKKISEKTSWNDGVLFTTIKAFDNAQLGQGCKVSESVEEIIGEDGTCLKIYETTTADGNGEIERSHSFSNGISYTRIKAIGAPPVNAGCVWSKSEKKVKGFDGANCYTIYDYTFAEGNGTVSETVKTNPDLGITFTTIESIGVVPNANGDLITQTTEAIHGQDGECFKRYKYTFRDDSSNVVAYEETVYNADGSVTYVDRKYGAAPQRRGTYTQREGYQVTDNGTLYWTVGYDPPADYTTRATARYVKRGKLSLNSDGTLNVVEPPVNQLVVAEVSVTYGNVQPANTIQECNHAPILERTLEAHNGARSVHTAVYSDYTAEAGEVTLSNSKFNGVMYANIKSKLYGGSCTGDPDTLRITSTRIARFAGVDIMRIEVYSKI